MHALRDGLTAVGCPVLLPGDTGYDEVRLAHQRGADQHPDAVAWPQSAGQIAGLLAAARARGRTVAVQAGGHGASEDLRGSVLLRLDAFDRIDVDAGARTMIVGAGVRAGAVAAALDGTGLFAAVGTSPLVSPVGLIVNGGLAWVSDLVGLAAQTVRRFHVVLPDGAERWVDDDSDPDLVRLLRGAGGVLAVVVEVELELVEAPALTGGSVEVPADRGELLWRAVRDAAPAAGTFLSAGSVRLPDLPVLPPELRGKHAASAEMLSTTGDTAAFDAVCGLGGGESWTRPIRAGEVATITDDPTMPSASDQRGILLRELPDELIRAVLDLQRSDEGAALVVLGLRRVPREACSQGRPTVCDLGEAEWLLHALAPIAPGSDGAEAGAVLARVEALAAPWAESGTVPTFLGRTQTLADALTDGAIGAVREARARLGAEVIRPTRLP